MSARPAAQFLTERPIAHRGLHEADRPENSLAAFHAAIASDYAIELDVRLTADGDAVVFHDTDLGRLTGASGTVAKSTSADISRLTLLGSDEKIPLLADVLAMTEDRVPIIVEVKSEGDPAGPGERVCEVVSGYPGRLALMSFDPVVVDAFERALPDTPRGLLVSLSGALLRPAVDWEGELQDRAGRIDFVGCDVRGLPYDPIPSLRGRVAILGWTVTSAEAERRARRWCDNIIFEGYQPVGK